MSDPKPPAPTFGRLDNRIGAISFELGNDQPASNDLVVIPAFGHIGPCADNQVDVVCHFGMEGDLHREQASEDLLGLLDPISAVLLVRSRDRIPSTHKGTLHAPIPAVIDADLPFGHHVLTRASRHRPNLPKAYWSNG